VLTINPNQGGAGGLRHAPPVGEGLSSGAWQALAPRRPAGEFLLAGPFGGQGDKETLFAAAGGGTGRWFSPPGRNSWFDSCARPRELVTNILNAFATGGDSTEGLGGKSRSPGRGSRPGPAEGGREGAATRTGRLAGAGSLEGMAQDRKGRGVRRKGRRGDKTGYGYRSRAVGDGARPGSDMGSAGGVVGGSGFLLGWPTRRGAARG